MSDTRSFRKSKRGSEQMHFFLEMRKEMEKCPRANWISPFPTYRCDGVSVFAPRRLTMVLRSVSSVSTNISSAREMMTGTGAATLPTSSSLCMIFLMRA